MVPRGVGAGRATGSPLLYQYDRPSGDRRTIPGQNGRPPGQNAEVGRHEGGTVGKRSDRGPGERVVRLADILDREARRAEAAEQRRERVDEFLRAGLAEP